MNSSSIHSLTFENLCLSIEYGKGNQIEKITLSEPGKEKKEISPSKLWINNLAFEHIKGFRHLDLTHCMHCSGLELKQERLQNRNNDCILGFEKKEEISGKEIATHLWLNIDYPITSEVIFKVNQVAVYLKKWDFEIIGVSYDGNSFCNAFLKSYKSIPKKIPALETQENQITFLRKQISYQLDKSSEEAKMKAFRIEQGIEKLTSEDAALLAKALKVHIRIIKVGKDGIEDILIFPQKSPKKWEELEESEKQKNHEYISIVDLEDHFIYAKPIEKICTLNLGNWELVKIQRKNFKKREFKKIKISVEGDRTFSIRAITCLKVIGLKKSMAKKLFAKYPTLTTVPFKKWKLFHNGCELPDDHTLHECGIRDPEIVDLKFQDSIEGYSNLQMATHGSYNLVQDFRCCVSSIKKHIPIVCYIRTRQGHGTGFLIGKNKIITNAHVLSKKTITGTEKAYFFYREQDQIEITLTKFECGSHVCKNDLEMPNEDTLDFSIISFEAEPKHEFRLNQLVEIADSFFAKYNFEEKKETVTLIKKRANIIQHPWPTTRFKHFENPQGRKTIAYRETAIKWADKYSLHYESYTSEGSSGSLVMDDEGGLIGLHFSMCRFIDRALFAKLEVLIKKLGIQHCEKGDHGYSWKYKECDITLYHEGAAKKKRGMWISSTPLINDKKTGNLRSLIEHMKGEAWILNFLEKQYPDDIETYKTHMHCNIAIPAGRIFEKIDRNWKQGYEAMRADAQKTKKDLEKRRELEALNKQIELKAFQKFEKMEAFYKEEEQKAFDKEKELKAIYKQKELEEILKLKELEALHKEKELKTIYQQEELQTRCKEKELEALAKEKELEIFHKQRELEIFYEKKELERLEYQKNLAIGSMIAAALLSILVYCQKIKK